MDTSASAATTERKEGKSGIPEGAAFTDSGRKTSALAVAAAAAVAAQGGTCFFAHLAGSRGLLHYPVRV